MFSFFKNQEEEISAVFDIGNGSIGGALVAFSETEHPLVLYTHREPVTFHESIDSEKLLFLMERQLKAVAHNIGTEGIKAVREKIGHQKINHAFCVFASPWYISQTKVVSMVKEKPFVVTKRLVEDVIVTEENNFEKQSKEGTFGTLFPADVTAIERKVIQTKLNGYEVHDPYGKSATHLEVSLFTSLVSKEVLKKVEEVVHNSFRFKKIIYHSFALTSFSVIRDVFAEEESFLFIDVTAELTELSVTKRGVLQETLSFPSGRHTLIRSLSKTLHVSPEVALSMLSMHLSGHLEPNVKAQTTAALETFKREWCGFLRKSFLELSKRVALPKKIFYTADTDTASLFSDLITKDACLELPLGQDEASDKKWSATYLDSGSLHGFVTVEQKAKNDSFLLMESIFFNKLFNL